MSVVSAAVTGFPFASRTVAVTVGLLEKMMCAGVSGVAFLKNVVRDPEVAWRS